MFVFIDDDILSRFHFIICWVVHIRFVFINCLKEKRIKKYRGKLHKLAYFDKLEILNVRINPGRKRAITRTDKCKRNGQRSFA